MRKYVLILAGLTVAAVMAGCGSGSGTAATVVPGNTVVALTKRDIAAKSFFIKTAAGTKQFTFSNFSSAVNEVTVTEGATVATGTWAINTDNSLEISVSGITQKLKYLQQETNYWLAYDDLPSSKTLFRYFTNVSSATNYNPRIMGGAAIGSSTALPVDQVSLFSGNLTAAAGFLPGQGGFVFNNSSTVTKGAARFNQPFDVTYDGTSYFVLDYLNNAIRKIDSTGDEAGNVTTLKPRDPANLLITLALIAPQGITTDGTNLYVAETGNHVIRQIDIATGAMTTIAGTAATAGAVDATATAAKFNSPTGITTDGANLYVADSGNHAIRKIEITSKKVTTLAGAAGNLGKTDGTFTDARFNAPVRLTTDGSNLYVTDFNNRTIRKVEIATGKVTTLAGNADARAEQIDGIKTAAHFFHPSGITTDGTNLYVTDFNNIILPKPGIALTTENLFSNLIRKIVISSGEVTTVAGTRIYPEKVELGFKATASFAGPRGIVWDGTNLIVTNGTFLFETDGVSIFNQISAFNVILKVPPNLQ